MGIILKVATSTISEFLLPRGCKRIGVDKKGFLSFPDEYKNNRGRVMAVAFVRDPVRRFISALGTLWQRRQHWCRQSLPTPGRFFLAMPPGYNPFCGGRKNVSQSATFEKFVNRFLSAKSKSAMSEYRWISSLQLHCVFHHIFPQTSFLRSFPFPQKLVYIDEERKPQATLDLLAELKMQNLLRRRT